MIAAVKGCHAVLAALLFLMPAAAAAAENLTGAANELARKTFAWGRADPNTISWRNLSSLGAAELAQARSAFEAGLQEAGAPSTAAPSVSIRVTLSQNAMQYLLVEEAQNGDDRQVWIAAWKRTGAGPRPESALSLRSKLLWEQDEQILDAAPVGESWLMLSASRVTLREQSVALPAKAWPRDLRGRLRVTADTFQVMLPGMGCTGGTAPALHLDCRNSDEPWVLESAGRAIVLAGFAAARNYFDGRLVTQAGTRKTVPPFYSAAAFEEQGRTFWLLTLLDGRAQVYDAAFEPQAFIDGWGSDIAAVDGRCGSGWQVLATRAGDSLEPDAVQAFAVTNGAAVPLGRPLPLAGPVTAFWPSSAASVLVVTRDLNTGKYGAYVITAGCGS